jgi:hypothetical protein
MIFNTIIFPILFEANIYGFSFSKSFSYLWPYLYNKEKSINGDLPTDLSRKWYTDVGSKLIIISIINIFIPSITILIVSLIQDWKKDSSPTSGNER